MGENELRIDLVHEWFEGPRATVIANVQLLPGPRPSCCRFGFLRLRLRGLVNAGLASEGNGKPVSSVDGHDRERQLQQFIFRKMLAPKANTSSGTWVSLTLVTDSA